MSTIATSIEVNVPVRTAYNQWTQFEEFPQFMEGVKEVQQLDDRHLRWKAEIGGRVKEWETEITEQMPDNRIAWKSTSGPMNEGVVTFMSVSDTKSTVHLNVAYETEGVIETMGDELGLVVSSRVKST